ncbi:MAG: bifunctional oligoribonuclease/PAP phosphatase NrnA [Candidatus Omnitrophica bacterium]|nr:bifunctional oligoribonuclease/PAP phosphatase NrnA [Candidatus Omnitrophota bacterium]
MPLKKLVDALRKNKKFVLTTHVSMEPDALGSEIALCLLLRSLGKEVIIVNDDKILGEYAFLPGLKHVKRFGRLTKNIHTDCFVILDCSDLSRCGEVASLEPFAKTTLNIDHHISNSFFGDVNWVEPGVSSASEMVYMLYKKMRIPINQDIALLLFSGIATDTGFFRYANTSSRTLKAAEEFLNLGVIPSEVYRHIYQDVPFEDAVILAKELSKIKRAIWGKVVWASINRDILKNTSKEFDLGEHFLSFMRSIKGVEVAVLFKENLGRKKEIRVNFRSQGKVDVNKIAQSFGGGGHKTASGATIAGGLGTVMKKVLAEVKRKCV